MGGSWICPEHKKERQMICKTHRPYLIICPDCQAKYHTKRSGHIVDNIRDFLDELAADREMKRSQLQHLYASLNAQMSQMAKDKSEIDGLVFKGQQEVVTEADVVLKGYTKASEFAKQKMTVGITALAGQRQLCEHYLGVINGLDNEAMLAKTYGPDDCVRMIEGWSGMGALLAQGGNVAAVAAAEITTKKTEFMGLHYEILNRLKSLESSWLKYALADEGALRKFADDLFKQIDTDRNGQLDFQEVQIFTNAFLASLGARLPKTEEVKFMFAKYDTDHSNTLSYDESIALAKDVLTIFLANSKALGAPMPTAPMPPH